MLTYSTTLILFNNPQYKVAPTPSVIEYNTCMGGVNHSEKKHVVKSTELGSRISGKQKSTGSV